MIRAVLFDAAGTLIEPREPVGESYARIARVHGLALSAWRIADAFRRVFAQAPPPVFPQATPADRIALEKAWWREVVRQTFLAADSARHADDPEALFEALWHHFSQPAAWAVRSGARETLETLRARDLRTGVVSNFDSRLPALLDGLALRPLLDTVVGPWNSGAAKPDPRAFGAALEALGCAAHEALFVGDDAARDLDAARAAGLAAVDASALATLDSLPLLREE